MKIKYEFVTGELIEIEVPETMEQIIIGFEKEIKNSDRRETRRHNSVEELEGQGTQFADDRVDILSFIEQKEMKEIVHKALEMLQPQQRKLVEQIFLEGKSMAQIAREEGVTSKAIQDRINKIKNRLRKSIEKNLF